MTTAPSAHSANGQGAGQPSPSFVVAEEFKEGLAGLGLVSLDAVFACDSGRDLVKHNIGRFRRRLQFEVAPVGSSQPVRVFLKRYERPPILQQVRNWLSHHRRRSFASAECEAIERLAASGISVPRIVAAGEEWGILFEQRSFLMTEEIQDSQALERRLPDCFGAETTVARLRARRDFIRRLGEFIGRFHRTGHRHRDLYLSHVFCSDAGAFCLIDLARASRPIRQRRFQVKDLAQLHYSAPARHFSRTDRLRFCQAYLGHRKLATQDKALLRAVVRKTARMTRHNVKHGAVPPFLDRTVAGG